MDSKLESYRKAFDEARSVPTDEELREVWREIEATQELQKSHSSQALQQFMKSRGVDNDPTESITGYYGHGHDRVLQKWKVWGGQVQLRKGAHLKKAFSDPYPANLNDVQVEIDYWASRQHESLPGSNFDQNVRNRLEQLRHLYERYSQHTNTPMESLGRSHRDDLTFARMAIEEARKSVSETDGRIHPKVGTVVVKDGRVLGTAHRGEFPGCHAEFVALEKKLGDNPVTGTTVYTTLEPCTTRNHPKIPCAARLVERKVERVVIGMLDPNPEISGRGQRALRRGRITTDFFPSDLMAEVEELNREFTRMYEPHVDDVQKRTVLSLTAMGAIVETGSTHEKVSQIEIEILVKTPDDGVIFRTSFQSGEFLLLGGSSLPDLNKYDPALAAHYLDALESLQRRGLVRFEGGELYRLTGRGFEMRKILLQEHAARSPLDLEVCSFSMDEIKNRAHDSLVFLCPYPRSYGAELRLTNLSDRTVYVRAIELRGPHGKVYTDADEQPLKLEPGEPRSHNAFFPLDDGDQAVTGSFEIVAIPTVGKEAKCRTLLA